MWVMCKNTLAYSIKALLGLVLIIQYYFCIGNYFLQAHGFLLVQIQLICKG